MALWDQSVREGQEGLGRPYLGDPAFGFVYGQEEINQALSASSRAEALRLVPSQDLSGHGTHVAGIAAGNGRASEGRYRGVAWEADLLIVKLGKSVGASYPQTAGLMEAVDYSLRTSIRRNQPVAINISFGNNDGSHNGRSILETYLSAAAGIGRSSIVIGTGNEGTLGRHQGGFLGEIEQIIELSVEETESQVEWWLWKNYFDKFRIELGVPGSSIAFPSGWYPLLFTQEETEGTVAREMRLSGKLVRLFYRGPTPYNPLQQFSVTLLKETQDIGGIWKIRLVPEKIVTGEYDIWLAGALASMETRFLRAEENRSLTIPSTTQLPIAVGAIDSRTGAVAYFSGRGYVRTGNPEGGEVKPDLVAPGVDITSASPGGGYAMRSGTSMATPFVTGSAALLMQWGILLGNDTAMYGQRLKASLLRGAIRKESTRYPNRQEGWGRLCLAGSLPSG